MSNQDETNLSPITPEMYVRVISGCKALGITKGVKLWIVSITELGVDYSHMVKILVRNHGKVLSLYARHINRLADPVINLNNGNPLNKIQVVRA
jgi:hypothetical protein